MLRRRFLSLFASPSLAPATTPGRGMRLTFADEFHGFDWNHASSTSMGRTAPSGTWSTRYWWNDGERMLAGNAERQFYSDRAVGHDPFAVRDGVLEITARPSDDLSATLGQPYVSGLITTEGTFSQTYGHFEMRARLPRGRGLWPAFWLLPQDHGWPPEIDIMEVLGHEPTRFFGSIHSVASGERRSAVGEAEVEDLSSGFHTFGLSWRPDRLVWCVDGRRVIEMPTAPDMHRPMYMLANLAVGGTWPGDPDHTTAFPATMAIDSIRVYQFADF